MNSEALAFCQSLPCPMMILDLNGKVISVSDQFCQFFDLKRNKVINKLPPPTLLDKTLLSAINSPDCSTNYNVEHKLTNGKFVNATASVSVSRLGSSNVINVVFSIEHTRSTYHKAMENAVILAGIGTWDYTPETDQARFSNQALSMLQLKEPFPTWQDFKNVIYEDDIAIFDVFFSNHIEFEIPLNFEFRVIINDSLHWFSLKGEAVKSSDNTLTIFGSLVDCHNEKQVLEELSSAIESKKLAMEAGHIGTWQGKYDENKGWIWDWDHVANDMFHLDSGDIGNLDKWIERLHPEDSKYVQDCLINSLIHGDEFEVDYRVSLPNNDIIYVYAKGVVITELDGISKRIDGVCIDLTETITTRNKLTELNNDLEQRVNRRTNDLQNAMAKAEQASQAKSDFLAMMSHELRTPMNAIIGNLELAFENSMTPDTRALVKSSLNSADNLIAILNDILDLNKIEAGKLDLVEKPFSIFQVVDQLTKIFTPVAENKGIVLNIVESPELPPNVNGDEVRVRQILFNLIGNAIKFTEPENNQTGQVTLEVTCCAIQHPLIEIAFKIKDNGIGIDKETQSKLFSPFTQADSSTSRKYGGTGLGLSICGKLSDMMGGSIELESEPDKGSTFTVYLPFWRSSQAPSMKPEKLRQINLYVFEPSMWEQANTISKLLESEGFKVSFFINPSHFVGHDLKAASVNALFVDKYQEKAKIYDNLAKQLHDKNLVISSRENLNENRAAFSDFLIIPCQPLTKLRLLELFDSIEQSGNCELDADLDLGFNLDCLAMGDVLEESPEQSDILIVEDNPFNQELILKQMKQLGYSAYVADDGRHGIEAWQRTQPKLILTDCHMPNLNGYEMTKKIRCIESEQNRQKVPIIAITGAAMTGEQEHCMSIGMDDFVSKPVRLERLKQVMELWYEQ